MKKKIKFEDFRIHILPDTDAESPREDDNLGIMACWHDRRNLGDKDGTSNHADPTEFMRWLAEVEDDEQCESLLAKAREKHIILPLFVYEHGGITMRTGAFNDPWDSGQVGWIYASKEYLKAETGYTEEQLFGAENKAEEILKGEVATYDQWLQGDVYGFKVFKKAKGEDKEELDSCWGFYGDEPDNGIFDHLGIDGLDYEKWKELYHEASFV